MWVAYNRTAPVTSGITSDDLTWIGAECSPGSQYTPLPVCMILPSRNIVCIPGLRAEFQPWGASKRLAHFSPSKTPIGGFLGFHFAGSSLSSAFAYGGRSHSIIYMLSLAGQTTEWGMFCILPANCLGKAGGWPLSIILSAACANQEDDFLPNTIGSPTSD